MTHEAHLCRFASYPDISEALGVHRRYCLRARNGLREHCDVIKVEPDMVPKTGTQADVAPAGAEGGRCRMPFWGMWVAGRGRLPGGGADAMSHTGKRMSVRWFLVR